MTQHRQGDVLLTLVTEMPKGKKMKAENGRVILARGEATGHHHSIAVADVETATETAEGIFLRIMSTTDLVHQEHAPITLQPGIWKVTRQREYTPEEIRNVAD
jgi:hypothetical protein